MVIESAGLIVIERVLETMPAPLSATVKLTLVVPADTGVPVIVPVLKPIARLEGRVEEVQE